MVTVAGKHSPLWSTYTFYTHSLQLYIPQCSWCLFITGTDNFTNVSLVQKMFSELNPLTLIINCTHFLVVTYFLQEQKVK